MKKESECFFLRAEVEEKEMSTLKAQPIRHQNNLRRVKTVKKEIFILSLSFLRMSDLLVCRMRENLRSLIRLQMPAQKSEIMLLRHLIRTLENFMDTS